MSNRLELTGGSVIAALHLPPLPGMTKSQIDLEDVIEFAKVNARIFASNGVDAIYLQNAGGGIGPKRSLPNTIAAMAIITRAVRDVISIPLGVTLAGHDAAGSIAVAVAGKADFVRLKVYVGAMVKAEGVIEGCAYEALSERLRLGAENVRILADIHDRTGVPLAPESLEDAADWASRFGKADALVVTGRHFEESLSMLDRVHKAGIQIPLICGGGATIDNVGQLLTHCDGVIVSSALKAEAPNPQRPWDPVRIEAFMAAVEAVKHK